MGRTVWGLARSGIFLLGPVMAAGYLAGGDPTALFPSLAALAEQAAHLVATQLAAALMF